MGSPRREELPVGLGAGHGRRGWRPLGQASTASALARGYNVLYDARARREEEGAQGVPGARGASAGHRSCPLVVPGVVRSSGAPGGCLRSPVVRQVPEPFADCPSVLVTGLPATWKPASSSIKPLHVVTYL